MWWDEQCPSRGAGLTHAHWDRCNAAGHPGEDSGHQAWQCCHCRGFSPPPPEPERPSPPIPQVHQVAPVDVAARMRSLGMMPDRDEDMEDIREEFERDDETIVEPRLADGRWQNGAYVPAQLDDSRYAKNGKGRGTLSPRQQTRLLRVMEQEAWLDEHRSS